MIKHLSHALLISASLFAAAAANAAPSPEAERTGREVAARAIEFLRLQQDEATGGWSHQEDGPNLPAISSLVLTGMLLDPAIDWTDPDVSRGIDYVLGFEKPGGGIHDDFLPTYNTAISISMLSMVPQAEAASAIRGGLGLLRRAQWGAFDPTQTPNPEAPGWSEPVPAEHPYYGGVGYGGNNRPDMSNMHFFMRALHDAGVSTDDPAFERALVFLRRTQMDGRINEMDYAEGSRQGGFIYATVPNAESIDSVPGQSQAGTMTEVLADGTRATRLRAYGSMTYAGFKSLIYADLSRDDPRVQAARRWLSEHYTLEENPGLGDQGLYYYYLVMGRALDAFGESAFPVEGEDGETERRRWADDLIDRLAELQRPDGSFEVRHPRWMEDNEVLITAYGLIALQHALH